MNSEIKFADEKVKESFEKLKESKTEDENIYKWICRAFEDLEKNAFCGIRIPKKLIPKVYVEKYQIDNLWKYDLPRGWRLIYSVANGDVCVLSIILEWMNHKNYERRFKY
jgi:Txe/YoeB family toxin of Txe-Axe toxin-antitoxin module